MIEFIEETIFSRITLILQEEGKTEDRCLAILTLILAFAERNPGMCRILIGDALAGEVERLRTRVAQFFDRLETQLKQVMREAQIRDGLQLHLPLPVAANLMLAVAEGRINQFVRSEFAKKPTEGWQQQWQLLQASLLSQA